MTINLLAGNHKPSIQQLAFYLEAKDDSEQNCAVFLNRSGSSNVFLWGLKYMMKLKDA